MGGDKALVRAVLDDPRLAHLDGVPRRELYDLPDPRRAVLEDALRRGQGRARHHRGRLSLAHSTLATLKVSHWLRSPDW